VANRSFPHHPAENATKAAPPLRQAIALGTRQWTLNLAPSGDFSVPCLLSGTSTVWLLRGTPDRVSVRGPPAAPTGPGECDDTR